MLVMDMELVLGRILVIVLMDTLEMIVKFYCATQRMNQQAVQEMEHVLESIYVLVILEKQEMNAS
jgi:hypothetical protein